MAQRISTSELVNIIYDFCELYSGRVLYPYQEQFCKRFIRSILDNDGEEITALFARQSGKSEAVAVVSGGLMTILPTLANMPMFAGDKRLEAFKEGIMIGIFAPTQRQAQMTFNKIKARLGCKSAKAVLEDPEFRIEFTVSNGTTVALTNGSSVTSISASEGSNIEGESFHLIICEESQDISNYKLTKCLTGDTRVLLTSGEYKRLDEIVKQGTDSVVSFNSEMKYLTNKTPTEYYDNGVQDVYELRLNNGDTIKATLNHQFYTYSKNTKKGGASFRTVQDIIKSQSKYSSLRIGVPDRLPYFAPNEELDYEKGLIIGYFLGDGCMRGTPQFIGDIPTCQRLHCLIKEVVSPKIDMTESHFNRDNLMLEVLFSSDHRNTKNPLTEWLRDFGVYGLKGEHKKLPDKLYSENFYLGLIEALIETDGCVESCTEKPIISFANISEELVRQLKDIYLKFGVHSTIFSRDNDKGFSNNTKRLWLLHVKSVKDLRVFANHVVLFRKQVYLDEAMSTIKIKVGRNESYRYPDSMRFYQVTDITYVGKEHTYCLKVEGRNFIANNMISSNSIHPMGAAYNATHVKVGTSTKFKAYFYEAILRNKEDYKNGVTKIRNHFEYNGDVVKKYNPKYALYLEKEKRRLGENSDEYQMSYNLKWIIERGMFIDLNKFEANNVMTSYDTVLRDRIATHVAGIDVGGADDDTWITICEVDWDMPVIMETKVDEESGEEVMYLAYNTYLKAWCRIRNMPDHEEQYPIIMDFLSNFKLARVVCDATREKSVADRLNASLSCEVIPYVFGSKSKSDLYKHFSTEITTGRCIIPGGEMTKDSDDYIEYIKQMCDLQKGWRGNYLVVSHPAEKGAHDDAPDSHALAVWGCSFSGTVNNTETQDRSSLYGKSRESASVCQGRNKLTAKRRGR